MDRDEPLHDANAPPDLPAGARIADGDEADECGCGYYLCGPHPAQIALASWHRLLCAVGRRIGAAVDRRRQGGRLNC